MFRKIEAWTGFFSALLVGFITSLVCMGLVLDRHRNVPSETGQVGAVGAMAVVALLIFDVNLLKPAWSHRNDPQPAIEGALEVSRWLPPARVAAAAWGTFRFLNGLVIAFIIESRIPLTLTTPIGHWLRTAGTLTVIASVFSITYASNTYLVLAAGSFIRSRTGIKRVWSLRLLWDAAIALVAGLYAVIHP